MKDKTQQKVFYKQIGENICTCRKRSKLSQEKLAKLIGLTRTSLTNIENGRQHPPLHIFCEISEKLGVDISELLPRPYSIEPIDIATMFKGQLRGDNELEFIQKGIGLMTGGSYGDTKTKDSDNS